MWRFNVGINQFREGSIRPYALKFKPSDLGLPAYQDQKAGALSMLPQMNVAGYSTISPGGYSTCTRNRMLTAKLELSHIGATIRRGRPSTTAITSAPEAEAATPAAPSASTRPTCAATTTPSLRPATRVWVGRPSF